MDTSKVKLTLLTPSIREQNLPVIARQIAEYHHGEFDLTWLIVLDFPEDHTLPSDVAEALDRPWIQYCFHQDAKSFKGISQCNHGLDLVSTGFVCFSADDNCPHPQFFQRLEGVIAADSSKRAIIVSEQRSDGRGILRAAPENMRVGQVDGAQIVVHRSLLGNWRFPLHDCCDGLLCEWLHREHEDKIVYVDDILAGFEVLRW